MCAFRVAGGALTHADHRQRVEAMHEVVDERPPLAHLEAFYTAGERGKDRVTLDAGEALADTRMHAVAEADVTAVVAMDVEALGIVPLTLVTVGRGERDHESRALGHGHSVDLGV